MIKPKFDNATAEPYPKRVFCDVHRTLEEPLGSGGPPWNEMLLHRLKEMQDDGFDVIIFSGSPGRCQSVAGMCRLVLGDADIFGPVRSKKEFKGKGTRAAFVFDDDHASHDIDAQYKLGPLDDMPAMPGMRPAAGAFGKGGGYVPER